MALLTTSIIGLSLAVANSTIRAHALGKKRGRFGSRNILSSLPVFLAPFMWSGFSAVSLVSIGLFSLPLVINSFGIVRKFNNVRRNKKGPKVNAYEDAKKAVERKERSLDRSERLSNRLSAIKGRKFFSWAIIGSVVAFLAEKNSERLSNLRTSIQDLYLQKGTSELALKNLKSVGDKFISVSEVTLPDGFKRYEVGRDLKPGQIAEIKEFLSTKMGVDINNPEVFAISRDNNNDLGSKYSINRVAMYYDRKNGTLNSVGVSVDELKVVSGKGKNMIELSVREFIEKANESMKTKGLRNFKDIVKNGYPGGLHLGVLGNSGVALIMDGVVLAHAIAGNDGRIRLIGSDGMQGTGAQKRLVSKLNERLKSAATMQEWCDIARNIILQPENIKALNNGLIDKNNNLSTFKTRENLRKKIINAPKRSLKALGRSL